MTEYDCERNGNGVRVIEYNAGIEYVAAEDEQINSMMELMGATEIHDMDAPDNWVCWEY